MGGESLLFFYYLCNMKEVLYKKEFVKYECNLYQDSTPINEKGEYVDAQDILQPTNKHPLFLYSGAHNNEEFFSENFQNQIASVSRYNVLVVIERNGDKIAMKLFDSYTYRRPGVAWFQKSKNMIFITVNTKTGDVYSGGIERYHLKRKCKKYIRRNYFADGTICTFQNKLRSHIGRFNPNEVSSVITLETITTFLNLIDPNDSFTKLKPSERLFKFYLDKRGYKYPNNFNIFMDYWYGPDIKKCLNRNDNRVIDAFMELYKLSGKKIKKVLHQATNFYSHVYNVAHDLFGSDWLNQDEELLLACFNKQTSVIQAPEIFKELITHEELKRVYTLFKQVILYENMNAYTFHDHIRMYCELKELGENIKWLSSADNTNTFREEHLDWTDKLEHYRQGSYYRIYPEYTYELINEPFEVSGVVYTPALLDDSTGYNEESSSQSNCVKGYVGKCSSMIISLRRGEGDEMERATLEYQLTYKKDLEIVRIERVQSLGRFNAQLSSDWIDALLKLDKKVLYYVKHEKFDTVKIKKKCRNGVELESTSVWNDMGHLRWNKKTLDKTDRYYYNNEYFE